MFKELEKALDDIKRPLFYEPKNNFKDNSVIGGFSNFALKRLSEVKKSFVEDNKLAASLSHLIEVFSSYKENPSLDIYSKILNEIKSIENYIGTEDKHTNEIDKKEVNLDTKDINLEAARSILVKPIQFVKGVGPKKASLLERLGISTLFDLLYYFPRDYIDRSKVIPIRSARVGEEQTFCGKIVSVQEFSKNKFSILKVTIYDGTSAITGVFFNQRFLKKVFEEHIEKSVIFSGKVSFNYGSYEIDNAEYEFVEERRETIHTGRIVPVYKLTQGIYPKVLRGIIKENLDNYKDFFYEFIPPQILSKLNLPIRSEAIYELHFPVNFENLEKARKRIVFEEFILGQYKLCKAKNLLGSLKGISFNIDPHDIKEFEDSLPFKLTVAQKKVISELINDLNSGKPMNRLLHGDVGSGKTVIAGALIYLTVKSGFQAAFMAPTEILSEQSYRVIKTLLSKFGFKVELLVSEMKSKKKEEIYKELRQGSIDVVIGTHAIIQEDVLFNKLATVIVDEQHRFGVRQREALKNKGVTPHMLVMSATPIPRTVAMTRFGDLDISVLDEMPKGKRKVVTKIVLKDNKREIYEFVRKIIKEGGKTYVVCPLIEESSSIDLASSIAKAEELKKVFPEYKVTLLHGRMSVDEKEEATREFSKESDILVSTTVIEVGIDIPDASVIIVEDAQRFGLAQIHQLRGRIGRKSQDSYCFLLVDNIENSKRLKILEDTDSGFIIAEKDLELRGPGELFGEKQHGYFVRSLVDLTKDVPLLDEAKKAAQFILENPKAQKLFEEELAFRDQFLKQFEIVEAS
jgi:ATP-dependent DNA helicase RecG